MPDQSLLRIGDSKGENDPVSKKKKASASRRKFLQLASAASLAAPSFALSGVAKPLPQSNQTDSDERHAGGNVRSVDAPSGSDIEFPRIFTGRKLPRISMPLGGIGTGGIGLGGRGNLLDLDIFNRPNKGVYPESGKGNFPEFAFPAIWIRVGQQAPKCLVVERRYLPPYDISPEGLGSDNAPGLPRFAEAVFHGSFPLARIEFQDKTVPVDVALEAFSSFQPVDADLSGLPCAILNYEVRNPKQEEAEVVIAWTLENPVRKIIYTEDGSVDVPLEQVDPRHNESRHSDGIQGIVMTNPSLPESDPLRGSVVLAVFDEKDGQANVLASWPDNDWRKAGIQRFWFDDFSKTGNLGREAESRSPISSVSMRHTIPAGKSRRFRFLLSWHFPNRTPKGCGWDAPKGKETAILGNYYCTRFSDAWAVAEYVQNNFVEIEGGTKSFVRALQTSTLPAAVIEAASANLSTLVSNTSFRIADGSFHGFEACGDSKGWGFGSCTHVWNYEVATQFLFPVLSQSMRGTSFGYATDAEGRMDFRHKLPLGEEHWGPGAADGQMGQIVKLFLDWRLSGDTAWLHQLWPACKRAMEFAWRPGGWDGNQDGVMEGVQHNTYDIEFYGPNPLCESWYLAALRSCVEMGNAAGDTDFAAKCQKLYQEGSNWTDANLFNGEYYYQQVRPFRESEIATGLRWGEGAKDPLHPDFQVGPGCLVDQLLGQYIADLAGLGPLLNIANIKTTVASIYKYNYKRSMYQEQSVERCFAVNDQAALILCDYTNGGRPEVPMPYYSENFTGSEYAAAIVMMKYGEIRNGVECIGSIRRRFDGEQSNPYCEVEWGRHYARAMASWGAIPMLSGFLYNGVTRELTVKPLTNADHFRSFWSAPTGWGSVQQALGKDGYHFSLDPTRGSIALKQLRLDSRVSRHGVVKVLVGDRSVPCTVQRNGNDALFILGEEVRVTPSAGFRLSVV